jgi:ferric-dicitrate binding protein FerR (iron transport regulator)
VSEQSERDRLNERDEAALARLLQLGGARTPVPGDVEARVYEQVRREWEATNPRPGEERVYAEVRREWRRSGRRGRLLLPLAFAATAIVAVGLWLRPIPDSPLAPAVAAHVERRIGGAAVAGGEFHVGDRARTARGEGLSLRLADGQSLRLDENTAVTFLATNRIALDEGRLYADSGDHVYRDHGLVVETALGQVRDVGTQFAVATEAGVLRIAVREGRVDVEHAAHTAIAVAGERLQITGGSPTPVVEKLAPYDPWWDWTAALAPTFDVTDRSVLDVLRWAARETGRELVFEDDELRLAAMRIDLHGPVADFQPLEAAESVLATTRFRYRIEAERIVIER